MTDPEWATIPERPDESFVQLVWADYRAHFPFDDRRRLRLFAVPRFALNPSMRAIVLVRLILHGPRILAQFWRRRLVSGHACDWLTYTTLGPGLALPHPVGVVVGGGSKIGSGVIINQGVTIGAVRNFPSSAYQRVPRIGDRVTIYANALIVGDVDIGDDAVIGAHALVFGDVPPGTIVPAGTTVPSVRRGLSH